MVNEKCRMENEYKGDKTMILTDEERAKFEEVTKPLIKFMEENYHPHTKVIVDCGHAELVEGVVTFTTDKFI